MTYQLKNFKYFKKKSKHFNVSTEYNGIKYHSKLESRTAQDLDYRLKAKDILSWERQVKIEINVVIDENDKPVLTSVSQLELKKEGKKFFHITNYYIDFVTENKDGTKDYIECKGMEMDLWKLKWKFTEAIFRVERPEVNLILVK